MKRRVYRVSSFYSNLETMKWYKILLLSLLSGFLLALSWYPHGVPALIFIAVVPLFFVSDALLQNGSKVTLWKGFISSYPAFVLWNAITTYWIVYCTIPGGIAAVVLNAMLQALVFGLWHASRKRISKSWLHPVAFISFWMAFEYLHLNWDLTWPWLNLGNVFANTPRCVQWYSVTGTLGGTLWVLTLNYLIYCIIKNRKANRARSLKFAIAASAFLIVPCIISEISYSHFTKTMDKSTPVDVVVVQPNTDVWTEEYQLSNHQHIQRILQLAAPRISDSTDLVVCPESCIPHTLPMAAVAQHPMRDILSVYGGFSQFDSLLGKYPDVNFILGLSTYEMYDHKSSPSAQPVGDGFYADQFNTAVCYGKGQYNGHHHKCRLVPGVEAMPYPQVFGFLSDLLIDLGGSSTSLGKDTGYRVFPVTAGGKHINVSTDICYESIYGELNGRFVRNGSNLITVITNDSWWKNTPGHRQHFEMSRLRAVESRRYVVRAANGGISGIIDPMGNVVQKTKYGERKSFATTVYAQDGLTFYAKYGDYLAWIAIFLFGYFIIYCMVIQIVRMAEKRKSTRRRPYTRERQRHPESPTIEGGEGISI